MFGLFKKKEVEKKEEIYIENDIGRFLVTTYGKTTPMFEGKIDWPDTYNDVEVMVICDECDENIQINSFDYLRKIMANKTELDEKIKTFILNNQIEEDGLVHIWGNGEIDEEPEPISGNDFIQQIHLLYIRIYKDATAEFVYPADGLYTDHDLVVRVDNDLFFMECVLEG